MFKEYIRALADQGIFANILVVAPNHGEARRVGLTLGHSFTAISYADIQEFSLFGYTYGGAVLVDPPQPKAHVPLGLPNTLLTAASTLGLEHYTELIKIMRNGKLVSEYPLDPTRWWCRECHTTRPLTPAPQTCWKCGGTDGYHPVACCEDQQLPDVNLIRALAKQVGYAIGEHGSRQKDLDVIAAPWTDDAVTANELVAHIADGLKNDNGPCRIYGPEEKPCGRLAYNIQINGAYKLIDISVMPKVTP